MPSHTHYLSRSSVQHSLSLYSKLLAFSSLMLYFVGNELFQTLSSKSFYFAVKLLQYYKLSASSALENIMLNRITAAGTMDNINTEIKHM